MPASIHIAVDIMGGDLGPHLCVSAAQKFLATHPAASLTLVGDASLNTLAHLEMRPQLVFQVVDEVVSAQEKPSQALRHKPMSSMAQAVRHVAEGRAQACVSPGNTGALMAYGLHLLGTIPGIERPAICKAVPTRSGVCWLLDLGANIEGSARQLLQFAQMGTALAQVSGVASPRVAVLNVGAEAHKGGELQREVAKGLQALDNLNYCGFVEGGDIYRGLADVVVCDGFSGNVLLKASEGVAELLRDSMVDALNHNLYGKCVGFLLRPLLRKWRARFDPALYNGASLLGLNGVVVKSHGATSEAGFIAALNVAYEQAQHQMLASILAAMTPA